MAERRALVSRPAGRKAWCPRCALVDSVDDLWRCLWCLTRTLSYQHSHPAREPLFATAPVVLEAHRLHAEGMTVMEAAAATIARTGYRDLNGYSMTLRGAWEYLALPSRSRSDAQALRARKTPQGAPQRAQYRHDVDTRDLAETYRLTRSTTATARAHGMSQQGTYTRLVKAGVITPKPRAPRRARTAA